MSTRANDTGIDGRRGDLARLLLGVAAVLAVATLALVAAGRVEASNGAFAGAASGTGALSTDSVLPPGSLLAIALDEETIGLSWAASPTAYV